MHALKGGNASDFMFQNKKQKKQTVCITKIVG